MHLEIRAFGEKYKTQVSELVSNIQREEFGLELTLGEQPDKARLCPNR
jgi:hypothetical protein